MTDYPGAPLERTDGANLRLTLLMSIIALILLVFGNNAVTKNLNFVGTDFDDLLNNVGLALIIASITQYYTDFKVKNVFYKDISDNIIANQTHRDSGILKFYGDSKQCLPVNMLNSASTLDIGMVYSDRFLKDNLGVIESRGAKLKIRVFCPDLDDKKILSVVSGCIDRKSSDVKSDYEKLKNVIDSIKNSGVTVELHLQKSMPHYSFYVINGEYFFLTLSTFASRRANVPLFQTGRESPLAKLINDDINHVIAAAAVTAPEGG